MSQTANSYHRNLGRGLNIKLNKWIENSNASAKQGACRRFINPGGQSHDTGG